MVYKVYCFIIFMVLVYSWAKKNIQEIEEFVTLADGKVIDEWFREEEQQRIFGKCLYNERLELIASYCLVKTAVIKALGILPTQEVNFWDIEVSHTNKGKYNVTLYGSFRELKDNLKLKCINVNIRKLEDVVEAIVELNIA